MTAYGWKYCDGILQEQRRLLASEENIQAKTHANIILGIQRNKVLLTCDVLQMIKGQLTECRDPQYAAIIQNMMDLHIAGCDTCKKSKS